MSILNFFRGKKAQANAAAELPEEPQEPGSGDEGSGEKGPGEDVSGDDKAALDAVRAEMSGMSDEMNELSHKILTTRGLIYAIIISLAFDLLSYFFTAVPLFKLVIKAFGIVTQGALFTGFYAIIGIIDFYPPIEWFPTFSFVVLIYYGIMRATKSNEYSRYSRWKKEFDVKVKKERDTSAKLGVPSSKHKPLSHVKVSGRAIKILIIAFLVMTIGFFAYVTIAPEMAARTITSVQDQDIEQATQTATSGVLGTLKQIGQSFTRTMDLARGKTPEEIAGLQGEARAEAPAFVGLEFKDPYSKNPDTVLFGEEPEIAALLNVYGYKSKIGVNVSCYVKLRTATTTTTYNVFNVAEFGTEVTKENAVYPKSFNPALAYTEQVICYPNAQGFMAQSGTYLVTLVGEGRNLFMSVDLENNFVGKDELEAVITEISKAKGGTIKDVNADIKQFYTEIGYSVEDPKSEADKGPIIAKLETKKAPVIGVDTSYAFPVTIEIENLIDGAILDIKGVTLKLPEGFKKVDGLPCASWNGTGNELMLATSMDVEFSKLKKGEKKKLPSCTVQVTDIKKVLGAYPNEPNKRKFSANFYYDYTIFKQQELKLQRASEFNDEETYFSACTATKIKFEKQFDEKTSGYNLDYYTSFDAKTCIPSTLPRNVSYIVLHHTGGTPKTTAKDVVDWILLEGGGKRASFHYLIDMEGNVYYIVDENRVAWHAGCSTDCIDREKFKNINTQSIGIEMINPGTKDAKFTDAQYTRLSSLIAQIAARHNIPVDDAHILAHYEISDKKYDPSPNFDWAKIGLSGHQRYYAARANTCPVGWAGTECKDAPTGLLS